MASTDGNIKMKHKLRSWTLITKATVPNTLTLKKTLVHKAFVVLEPNRKCFYLSQEDKIMRILSPSFEHYFLLRRLSSVFFTACVKADFLLTFRFLTTAINPLQIHLCLCPPLSSKPLILHCAFPPERVYKYSSSLEAGEMWHSCIRRNMALLGRSYNQCFIGE